MTTIERVRKAISEGVGSERLRGVGAEYLLVQNGIINSLEIVIIGLELEKEFGLKIPDTALSVANFASLTSLAAMISAITGDGGHAPVARDEANDLYGRLHCSLMGSLRRPLLFTALFAIFLALLDLVGLPFLVERGPLRTLYASFSDNGERLYRSSGGWAPEDLHVAVARHRIMKEGREGQPRILFFGDSGTVGSWVRAEDAPPAQVEARLRQTWSTARVYNFGFFMRSFAKDAMLLEALLKMTDGDLPVDAVIFTFGDAYFHKPFQERLAAAVPYLSLNRDLLHDLAQRIDAQAFDAYARITEELATASTMHRNRFTETVLQRSSVYRYKSFLQFLMLHGRASDAFWASEYAIGDKSLLPARLTTPPPGFQLHDVGFDAATLDRDVVRLVDDVVDFLTRRGIKIFFFLRPYAPLEFKGHPFGVGPMTIDNLIRERGWDHKATIIDLRWSLYGDQFSDSLSHYTPAGSRVLGEAIATVVRRTLSSPQGSSMR